MIRRKGNCFVGGLVIMLLLLFIAVPVACNAKEFKSREEVQREQVNEILDGKDTAVVKIIDRREFTVGSGCRCILENIKTQHRIVYEVPGKAPIQDAEVWKIRKSADGGSLVFVSVVRNYMIVMKGEENDTKN